MANSLSAACLPHEPTRRPFSFLTHSHADVRRRETREKGLRLRLREAEAAQEVEPIDPPAARPTGSAEAPMPVAGRCCLGGAGPGSRSLHPVTTSTADENADRARENS
jgi:hypothetical protein